MALDKDNLKVIGACQGFALWHYATTDDILEVMEPGYFNDAAPSYLRPGHQIHLSAKIQQKVAGEWHKVPHNALLAVESIYNGVKMVCLTLQHS